MLSIILDIVATLGFLILGANELIEARRPDQKRTRLYQRLHLAAFDTPRMHLILAVILCILGILCLFRLLGTTR